MLKCTGHLDLQETYKRVGIEQIYEHQKEAWDAVQENKNIILAAGTGAGKTEAVLLPALVKGLRVVLVYPTKALLQDQVPRVQEIWQKVHGQPPTGHISIDTGDDNDETRFRADVILTTIDKLLYRVFGYGSARWGYIYPWRIAQSSQKKTLLVFDEAHAYDEIPLTHFLFLVDKLTYEKGVQTAVLSATLPQALIEHLQDDPGKTFPKASGERDFFQLISEKPGDVKRGTVKYCRRLSSADEVVSTAIKAYSQGQQVIIVANRVYPRKKEESTNDDGAQGLSVKELWEALRNKSELKKEDLILYHGHQSPSQRRKFLEELQKRDASRRNSSKQPYILVTTSAFEVGVDVSCDLMFTEVCAPDAFVQRIGRCARRSSETGEVYTFGSVFPKALPEERVAQEKLLNLLDQHKDKGGILNANLKAQIQSFLRRYAAVRRCGGILNANLKAQINALNVFDPTLLTRRRNTIIYTVDASLYDYVYNFVATGAEMWRKGVLVTRDWVPSLEIQPDGASHDDRLRLPVTYSVDQQLVKGWWFEVRDVDGRPIRIHGKDVIKQLQEHGVGARQQAVNAYQATLVIWLKPEAWDNDFGLKERQFVSVNREFAGLSGMRRCQAKPLPNAPELFWFEPEEEM